MNVLLVEDEPRVSDFIDRGLRAENHGVTVAPTGGEGVDLAKTGEFDVIVLDLMLPDMHGYDVCQRLRQDGNHTPILMLTAMDALEDKIKGIKIGADDYLTKPFDFPELEARMRALLRRSRPASDATHLQLGNLKLDREARRATVRGEALDLSPREWLLLELLLTHRDKVATKEQIAQAWGTDRSESGGPGSTEVYIHRLRRKIEDSGLVIRTVRGLGYLLETEAG